MATAILREKIYHEILYVTVAQVDTSANIIRVTQWT